MVRYAGAGLSSATGWRVEFEKAKRIGDAGERVVAAELDRMAPQYDFVALHDLLLKVGPMTAQLDHVVIDRFGVLILESKVRTNALIKGNDREKKWTACYPSGKYASFQNPLRQNEEHENVVRQALEAAGNELEPDYVKSAVVCVGANLSELKLDSLSRARVVDVEQLEELLKRRHAFALNPGDISPAQIATLSGLLRGLNRATDESVVGQHVAYRGGTPVNSATPHRQSPIPAQPRTAWTRPPARPLPRGAERQLARPITRLTRGVTNAAVGCLARLFILVAVGFGFWWLFVGPGAPLLTDMLLPGPTAAPTAAPQASPGVGNIPQAKAALQEYAPDKYPLVSNLDTPIVTTVPEGTTYTWEYVVAAGNTAEVKTIALTLDRAGQLKGVNIP